jgi:hypothetical protein
MTGSAGHEVVPRFLPVPMLWVSFTVKGRT